MCRLAPVKARRLEHEHARRPVDAPIGPPVCGGRAATVPAPLCAASAVLATAPAAATTRPHGARSDRSAWSHPTERGPADHAGAVARWGIHTPTRGPHPAESPASPPGQGSPPPGWVRSGFRVGVRVGVRVRVRNYGLDLGDMPTRAVPPRRGRGGASQARAQGPSVGARRQSSRSPFLTGRVTAD